MDRIPMCRPEIDEEMILAAADAWRNERTVMGESVFRFEEEFARYVGTKHAVSVSSGTGALILALLAIELDLGEVVTTPLTFIASANAIIHAHGVPTFADVGEDYNISPTSVEGAVSEDTKAILPVHLFGHPCRMDELEDIAADRELRIVEDACQAHGAEYRGRKVGSIGDLGCFSFYPTKNMSVGGDGGMVTTDDEELAQLVAKLRDCGRVSRYEHDVFGFTARLNTANAAIGRVQLKHLDSWNRRRREIATRYRQGLKDIDALRLPPSADGMTDPVYHLFVVRCKERDALAAHLLQKGVDTAVHYPIPVHLQPAYSGFDLGPGSYPLSETLSKELLSLPIFPQMTDAEVDAVCDHISEHLKA
jgi:perosamine synthetase